MVKYTCEDDSSDIKVSVEGTEDQLAHQIWMLIDDVGNEIQKHSPKDAELFHTILKDHISKKMQATKEALQ